MILARKNNTIGHWLTFNLLMSSMLGEWGSLLSTLHALKTNAAWHGLLNALFVLSGEPLLERDVVSFHSHCDFAMQKWNIGLK